MKDGVCMNYVAPTYKAETFNCPHCNAFAQQIWEVKNNEYNDFVNKYMLVDSNRPKFSVGEGSHMIETVAISTCQACKKYHVWHNGEMIVPEKGTIPLPVDGMPENVSKLYMEARSVFEKSPKSSCALLRLAIQVLCNELVEKSKNLDDAIKQLVSRGLPIAVQQAPDSIRVIGNNAVHPGEINVDDNKEIAATLFQALNIIIEKIIIEPQKMNDLFNLLPEGAKEHIFKRDNVK